MFQINPGINTIFVETLRSVANHVNQLLRDLISNFEVSTFIILILLSVVYGILHSIGPGHGKSLVASFFLKEKHPLKKSLILAAIISVVHTGSAVILSFLLYFVLTGIKGMFRIKMQSYFMASSGIFILIIGIFFLFLKIFHHQNHHQCHQVRQVNNSNLILIGISAGLVPCPVSLMIMLLSLTKKVVFIGLFSVLGISLGMFLLLTAIGMISIKSRDGILLMSAKAIKKTEIISIILEYVSIALIIVIGFGMSYKLIFSFFQ